MWLDEHDSKELLQEVGIAVPSGAAVMSSSEAVAAATAIGAPSYVKGLAPRSDRAAAGGVVRVASPEAAGPAFHEVTAALQTTKARVEEEIAGGSLWYVSFGIPHGAAQQVALFSCDGGSDIEARSESVASVGVDPFTGVRPFHARRLAELTGLPKQQVSLLASLLEACQQAAERFDAELVELNPVCVLDAPIALDARLIVDDYALVRQPRVREAPSSRLGKDAGLSDIGIEYVPLGGSIGIVGLGAGLTMHIADWIDELGGSAAFFFDATVAAVRDWEAMFRGDVPTAFAATLAEGLRTVGGAARVLIVNFTSGGTPVDALCKGLVLALGDCGWSGKTIVHVGGNRSAEARAVLRAAGLTHAETLGDAIAHAVALERELQAV